MNEQVIGRRRSRDMRFLTYAKRCATVATRDREDTQSAAMLLALLEVMRRRMALSACTYEDLIRALDDCEPRGSVIDPLPDEVTPAETPSALALEAQQKGTWRGLLRDLRAVLRWRS